MLAFLLAVLWSWDRVLLDCAGRQETVASYSLQTSIKTPQFMSCNVCCNEPCTESCPSRCVEYVTSPWFEETTVPDPGTGITVDAPPGFDIADPVELDEVIYLRVVAIDAAGNRSTACP